MTLEQSLLSIWAIGSFATFGVMCTFFPHKLRKYDERVHDGPLGVFMWKLPRPSIYILTMRVMGVVSLITASFVTFIVIRGIWKG
jgi:hypothetical protein